MPINNIGRGYGWAIEGGPHTKGDALLSREESKGNALPGSAEGAPEGHSSEDLVARLTDGGVTRAQALKLAGLGGAGFLLTLLWPADADARRRRRKRRRKKAQVTSNNVTVVPGTTTNIDVTNPGDTPLTISEVRVVSADGSVRDLNVPDVTIQPNETGTVSIPVTITDSLVDGDRLKLLDARGIPITLLDEEENILDGGINVDVLDVLP